MKDLIKKIDKKHLVIILGLVFIGVFIIIAGVSYSMFVTSVTGKDYVINTGTLQVRFSEPSGNLNVLNTYPKTNTEALSDSSLNYSFKVENVGTLTARYLLRIELDTSIKNLVPIEYIRLSYKKNTDEYSNPVLLSDLNSNLVFNTNEIIDPEEEDEYILKLWVDFDAPIEVAGKRIKAKVVIDAIQDADVGYDIDTPPVIILNKDTNGNIDINLIKNDTYTDLDVESVRDDIDTLTSGNVVRTYEYFNPSTETITTVNDINTANVGVYYETYTVTDTSGNVGKAVRVITVNNTATLPTITLNGSQSMTISEEEIYDEPGVTVQNNNRLITIGSIKYKQVGQFTIRYIVIDDNGNVNSAARTVNVVPLQKLRDKILADNTLKTGAHLDGPSSTCPGGQCTEIDPAGLYQSNDTNDGSATYYFRGNVTNNYVTFAGQTWLIVRINEDGTIRMILNEVINNRSDYYYSNILYSQSTIKNVVNKWYTDNIIAGGYSDKVAIGNYFCEDEKTGDFSCDSSKLINSNVGLITADEVAYAGGYFYAGGDSGAANAASNTNYYLAPSSKHIKTWYWTMTPYGDNKVWFVDSSTVINGIYSAALIMPRNGSSGLPPVINLKKDVKITGGTGTSANPYVISQETYYEPLLNGADPVLTKNLVPVRISNTGVVTKADTYDYWYSYENKQWANAIVLKDNTELFNAGEIIPESSIESYFVWIPKYSYQLFNLNSYTTYSGTDYTDPANGKPAINIRFGLTNTSDSNSGECTTPIENNQGISGSIGNCQVGDYMTHPAFISMNTNGLWVGKFEAGYEGSAPGNTYNPSRIVVKPNVYSWRSITVGNIFKNSLNYMPNEDSHMMKNTEWGAMAYLTNSIYGTCTGSTCQEVRINNNRNYITGFAGTEAPTKPYNGGTSIEGNRVEAANPGVDGTYTINYLNTASGVASTNGNYTGIYDTSGGAWEYVAGYTTSATTDNSTITTLYNDFYNDSTYSKYWDKYTSTSWVHWNKRILGDATGELGPFIYTEDLDVNADTGNYNKRLKSAWYHDYANFVSSSSPWFFRGGLWSHGLGTGSFAFSVNTGGADSYSSFRLVLAPSAE